MLSDRLYKIANFVTPGCSVVDVGCDHGYLSIELVRTGISPRAIATDVNRGPLRAAKSNIKEAGLSDRITTRLCDGLAKIKMFEADTLIIAGMGATTIMNIIKDNESVAKSFKEIILEPQSEPSLLRRFLYDNDFYLIDEDMVCEASKFYPIFKVATKKGLVTMGKEEIKVIHENMPVYDLSDLSPCELEFGPYLLKAKNEILHAYLNKELANMTHIYDSFFLIDSTGDMSAMKSVEKRISIIKHALSRYETK